jgi:hypothetical protein
MFAPGFFRNDLNAKFGQRIFTPKTPELPNGLTGGGGAPGISQPGGVDYGTARGDQESLRDSMLGDINKTRDLRAAGINEDYNTLGKNALSALSDRGLSGSNLNLTTRLGTERGRQRAMNDLDSNLLGQRVDVNSRYANNLLGLQRGEMGRGDDLLRTLLGLYGNAPGQQVTYG